MLIYLGRPPTTLLKNATAHIKTSPVVMCIVLDSWVYSKPWFTAMGYESSRWVWYSELQSSRKGRIWGNPANFRSQMKINYSHIQNFLLRSMANVPGRWERKLVLERRYEEDMNYACDNLFEMNNEENARSLPRRVYRVLSLLYLGWCQLGMMPWGCLCSHTPTQCLGYHTDPK